jgi:hypothetical protein
LRAPGVRAAGGILALTAAEAGAIAGGFAVGVVAPLAYGYSVQRMDELNQLADPDEISKPGGAPPQIPEGDAGAPMPESADGGTTANLQCGDASTPKTSGTEDSGQAAPGNSDGFTWGEGGEATDSQDPSDPPLPFRTEFNSTQPAPGVQSIDPDQGGSCQAPPDNGGSATSVEGGHATDSSQGGSCPASAGDTGGSSPAPAAPSTNGDQGGSSQAPPDTGGDATPAPAAQPSDGDQGG